MRPFITLLALAAALGGAVAFSAPSSALILLSEAKDGVLVGEKLSKDANFMRLADNDDDEEWQEDGDDEDDDDARACAEGADDLEDGVCMTGKLPAAPVSPPDNGLFVPGSAPKVQIN